MKSIVKCAITALVLFSACSSGKQATSSKATENNQVDGIPTEWGQPISFTDTDSGIEYAMANDDRYLFLIFRITNPQLKMKMLASGAKLWFDANGGTSEHNTIEFPLKKENGMPPPIDHEKNRAIMMEDLLLQKREAIINGFIKTPQGEKALDSIGEFQLKLLINNDESLVYEAAIPLANLYEKDVTPNKKTLTIGFNINGFKMSDSKPERGTGNGFPPGGGRRPGGSGGMGGGMPGGRGEMGGGPHGGHGQGMPPQNGMRGQMDALSKETKLKFKVELVN